MKRLFALILATLFLPFFSFSFKLTVLYPLERSQEPLLFHFFDAYQKIHPEIDIHFLNLQRMDLTELFRQVRNIQKLGIKGFV